jgi:hypothetical protein
MMRRLIVIAALAALSACVASPNPRDWRPVVVLCIKGHGCARPIWVYGKREMAWDRRGCRAAAADYNSHHFIPQTAVCRRIASSDRAPRP